MAGSDTDEQHLNTRVRADLQGRVPPAAATARADCVRLLTLFLCVLFDLFQTSR